MFCTEQPNSWVVVENVEGQNQEYVVALALTGDWLCFASWSNMEYVVIYKRFCLVSVEFIGESQSDVWIISMFAFVMISLLLFINIFCWEFCERLKFNYIIFRLSRSTFPSSCSSSELRWKCEVLSGDVLLVSQGHHQAHRVLLFSSQEWHRPERERGREESNIFKLPIAIFLNLTLLSLCSTASSLDWLEWPAKKNISSKE